MTVVRAFSVMAVLVMASVIVFGFVAGDFGAEGTEMLGLAWGKVTLVDLYVGLAIFALWVAVRERRILNVVVWWIGLIVLGNLAAALYLARAAFTSENVKELLLGRTLLPDPSGRHEAQ